MDTTEFSTQFDILYNNITSNKAPGLNEYEKSVFLTTAQEQIVKNHFNAKSTGNNTKEGFDENPKRQMEFSTLLTTLSLTKVNIDKSSLFDQRSIPFYYPDTIFIVLNEQIYSDLIPYTVVPISYTEYARLMSKPYKYPPKYQAWKLPTFSKGDDLHSNYGQTITKAKDSVVEIIGVFKNEDNIGYKVRFLRRPKPIILTDIHDIDSSLTIQGEHIEMTSELPESLHNEILQRAVELAKISWGGDVNQTQLEIQTGSRSE